MTWEELNEHVPLSILEAIVKQLQKEEAYNEEWPESQSMAALEVFDSAKELADRSSFRHNLKPEAIKVAARAIRFLKNADQ